jgi:flagellin
VFSINTNIASLEAQNYLAQTSNLQNATIQQVSSGLRITDAGVDAAGLAIANGYANDEAVLTQGIANANDGQSQLQTIDGGLNNISQLLQRASTLATESASSTFASGDAGRVGLNTEFQSVLQEVNRQAQAIGLNSGGQFAQDLSVFVGGGKASGTTTAINNGSVSVNLSNSAVDTQSLGLQGVQVVGSSANGVDLSAGQSTSVQNVLANTINQGSEATTGYTQFLISGPGFSDSNKIAVNVNLTGVTDTTTLADAINTAIQQSGSAGTQYATAFKNANINATIVTNASTGAQSLAFNSSSTAFQVEAGDQMANALMGVVTVDGGTQGDSVASTLTAAASTAAGTATFGAAGAGTISFRIAGGGLAAPENLSITTTANETVSSAITALNDAVNADTNLKALGITMSATTAGSPLAFTAADGGQLSVQTTGDVQNLLGMGSFVSGTVAGAVNDYTSIGAAAGDNAYDNATASGTATFQFSLNGGANSTISAALDSGNATQAVYTAGTIAEIPTATNALGTDGTLTGTTITPPSVGTPTLGAAATSGSFTGLALGAIPTTTASSPATYAQFVGSTINPANWGGSPDTTTGDAIDITVGGLTFSNIDVGGIDNETDLATAIGAATDGGGNALSTVASVSFVNNQLTITALASGSGNAITVTPDAGGNVATASEIGLLQGATSTDGTNAVPADSISVTIDGSHHFNNISLNGLSGQAAILNAITTTAGFSAVASANFNGAGKLVITSLSTGVGSSVAVTAGDAASGTDLGITGAPGATPGAAAVAHDMIDLTINGTTYSNIDLGGLTSENAIADAINAAITINGTASFKNDQLVITSATPGALSDVSVVKSAAGNAATLANLGLAAATPDNGVAGAIRTGDAVDITIDGVAHNNIAIAGATSEANLLSTINAAISGEGAGTGVASFVNDQLVVTSNKTGVGSTVAVTGANANTTADLNLNGGTGAVAGVSRTTDNLVAYLNDQIKGNADLMAAGLKAFSTEAGNAGKIYFSSSNDTNFRLNAIGGTQATVSSATPAGGFVITTGVNDQLTFAVDGGAAQTITLAASVGESAAALAADITTKIANLDVPGLSASIAVGSTAGSLTFTEQNGTGAQSSIAFSASASHDALTALGLSVGTTTGAGPDVGFGAANGSTFVANASAGGASTFDVAGGNQMYTSVEGVNTAHALTFSGIAYGSDTQSVAINAVNSNGVAQPLNVTLGNNGTLRNAATLDQAVATINSALQASNNSTLQSIVAVKDDVGGVEKINFLSSGTTFSVTAAQTANGTGIGAGNVATEQGVTQGAAQVGTGGTADISNQASAEAAVTALGNAVTALGNSQSVVGIGENEFTYASNLAQSQLTNETAAESQIRDANLAQQSAVLTKAQILLQAGVAALAQANSAPQQLLTLLQGH